MITETAAQLARRPATTGDAVLLHGAGSFGHFQAHKHGTSKGLAGGGWLGFCDTRGSVTLLNNHVVRALVAAGVRRSATAAVCRRRACGGASCRIFRPC